MRKRTGNGKKRNQKWLYIILTVGIVLIVFFGYKLSQELSEYEAGNSTYEWIAETAKGSMQTETEPFEFADEKEQYVSPVSFEKLREINPDVVGWIYCENTEINYPIVQGEDNSYYLTHLFDGTKNSSGSIFMEKENASDFSDDNTILYGHRMKNGSMFACLEKYKEQQYYAEHPEMMLYTPTAAYRIKLFAGYVVDGGTASFPINFGSDAEQQDFVEDSKERSTFYSEIAPKQDEKLITLCTCTYEFENARYVVVGKLEKAP